MPRIKNFGETFQVEDARQGIPTPTADPAAFGGLTGQSMQQLGRTLESAAVAIKTHRSGMDRLEGASAKANLDTAWEARYQQLLKEHAPGAPGFSDTVRDEYEKLVEQQTGGLSAGARKAIGPTLETARAHALIRAIQHEAISSAANAKSQADTALASTTNLVASNPTRYPEAVANARAVIESLNINGDMKTAFYKEHESKLTKAAFESRIYGAKSAAELDAVLADLATPQWQERASTAVYDHLLDAARNYRRTVVHGLDTKARSALEVIEDRMKDPNGVRIDPTEIASTDSIVKASQDPGVQWKWAKLRAQYDATLGAQRQSPDALRSAINGNINNTGLPPILSSEIERAARVTNGEVSASFLSRVVENGSADYIAASRRGKAEFAPVATHGNVDLRNVRQDVQDAAAVAGEIFGAPLRVNSGHRSFLRNAEVGGAEGSRHTHGDAFDFDITGMDAPTKGRLVDALVRAGFTRFGEYGTHIHADMGSSVPSSYDAAKRWGGWTYLSPEVAEVLVRRGFAADKKATEINRAGPDGKSLPAAPELPASGAARFDDKTWLDLVKRNGGQLQYDPAGKSDAELLKLRTDPRFAVSMAAIYARENKQQMQAALGRDVTDAELYMAHVMGPASAVILTRAFREAPNVAFEDVLPAVAKEHPELASKAGKPLMVGDVYTGFMGQFTGGVSALQHVRTEAMRDVQKKMEEARGPNGDIMTYAEKTGTMTLGELRGDDDFVNRGRQALEAQRFYNLPDPRPLRTTEVEHYTNIIKNGSVAETTALITQLQKLGPKAAAGAYRQLGQKDETFEHAAGLASMGEAYAPVANDIIRGMKRIRDNADVKQIFSTAPGGTDNQFNLIVGSALDAADPRARQAMRLAADALYIERYSSGQTVFDPKVYAKAVHAVAGGQGDTVGGLGKVNGSTVLLPLKVNAADFDRALDGLTAGDLASMSITGQPPRYRDGRIASPADIAYEGQFRAVGNDTYSVVMSDGLPLWSAQNRPYLIRMDADGVKRLKDAAASTTSSADPLWGSGTP